MSHQESWLSGKKGRSEIWGPFILPSFVKAYAPHERAQHQHKKLFSGARKLCSKAKRMLSTGVHIFPSAWICSSYYIRISQENPSLHFFCLGPALCHLQNRFFSLQFHVIRKKEHRMQYLMGINIRQWQNLAHLGYSKRGHYPNYSLPYCTLFTQFGTIKVFQTLKSIPWLVFVQAVYQLSVSYCRRITFTQWWWWKPSKVVALSRGRSHPDVSVCTGKFHDSSTAVFTLLGREISIVQWWQCTFYFCRKNILTYSVQPTESTWNATG